MNDTMKVLSVQNPWAYWIMYYDKTVENRTWKTKHRGRILIHASTRWDNNAPIDPWRLKAPNASREEIERLIEQCKQTSGYILGSVELYDCRLFADEADSWAQPGLWHWLLRDPDVWDKPLYAKGSLGLWNYTEKE